MSYAIIEQKGIVVKHIDSGPVLAESITAVLDSTEDLNALGTDWAPGSIAIVADKGAPSYMLNASRMWKEI